MFDQLYTDDALWTFSTTRFVVEFHALEESSDPADSFDDDTDVAFARDGGAHWFEAIVLVRDLAAGYVIGFDTLGGCSYDSFEEFMSSHRDPDPMSRNCSIMRAKRGEKVCICHYFPDMVRQAIRDARLFCQRYRNIKSAD